MSDRLDNVSALRIAIEGLLRQYPELANDEVLRADTLEGATDIREVLIRLGGTLRETRLLHFGIDQILSEMKERQARIEKREDFLRDLIAKVLTSADLKKMELPELTLSMRNNPPKLLGDADPNTLPDDLVKIARTVNRARIKELLQAGDEVPGFTLSNAEPSLTVRVK